MRALFSWVGFRDLNFIASQLNEENFSAELEKAKGTRLTVSKTSEHSPIQDIVTHYIVKKQPLNKLILFCDLNNKTLSNGVKRFFNSKNNKTTQYVDVIDICPKDVHDYSDVLLSATEKWRQINDLSGIEPFFNLSSGTTAMKAFLLILGQSRYADKARFVQNDDDSQEVKDFAVDFNFASLAVSEIFNKIDQAAFDLIKGNSPEIQKAKKYAAKIASTDCNVLIYGETGTGKELFARAIHEAGNRKHNEFYAVNCANLPPQLLESLLFGTVKGVYTGAGDAKGILEKLNGGTLFIDELEACPPEVQAKLLRILQPPPGEKVTCRCFSRLGSTEEIKSDIRIIAATNERLKKNDFRSDLLNRVSQLSINLPALRERKDDIRILSESLFADIKKQLGDCFANKILCESAIRFIESRAWFGNVRELQNALTQAIVFSETEKITEDDFDKNLPALSAGKENESDEPDLQEGFDLKAFIEKETIKLQKKYVEKALIQTDGNKTKAAELLGIRYQTIDNWKKSWQDDE